MINARYKNFFAECRECGQKWLILAAVPESVYSSEKFAPYPSREVADTIMKHSLQHGAEDRVNVLIVSELMDYSLDVNTDD